MIQDPSLRHKSILNFKVQDIVEIIFWVEQRKYLPIHPIHDGKMG